MADIKELEKEILDATIILFNRKGLKFTMDDIALELGMSKKTLYTVFSDKKSMFLKMVDYCFDNIKQSKEEVLQDKNLGTVEKLRKILGVLPEGYREIDFSQLYVLKDKYPKIYEKVEHRLETEWESTIQLIKQGMDEGKIRQIDVPVLKAMFEATLEQFFKRDILNRNNISYNDALNEVVNILVDGILVQA